MMYKYLSFYRDVMNGDILTVCTVCTISVAHNLYCHILPVEQATQKRRVYRTVHVASTSITTTNLNISNIFFYFLVLLGRSLDSVLQKHG